MANLVSLATLTTRAQQAADMENDPMVSSSEWTTYINYGAARLYDLLVSKFGDEYYLTSANISMVAGTDTYDLPADFYRLRGVDATIGGRTFPLHRFNFRDRDRYKQGAIQWSGEGGALRYMLQGHSIRFMPVPAIATGLTLWYIPTMQVLVHGAGNWTSAQLVNTDDVIDDVNGYSEFIVLEAAIHAVLKQDRDASALMARRDEVKTWLEDTAGQRDANEPAMIGEINNDYDPMFLGVLR